MVRPLEASILIGIPIGIVVVRDMFHSIVHHRRWGGSPADARRLLAMFRLPASFQASYRWFVPVDYGSILFAFFTPGLAFVWMLNRILVVSP